MKPWTYDYSVHPLEWRSAQESEYRDKLRLKVGVLRSDGDVKEVSWTPQC